MQYKLISWLLMATVLMLILSPLHFHMHHAQVTLTQSHVHEVDRHLLVESAGQKHHDEAHVLEVTPDGIMKQFDNMPLPVLLFAILLALLPFAIVVRYQRIFNVTFNLYQSCRCLTPPLRAPPL